MQNFKMQATTKLTIMAIVPKPSGEIPDHQLFQS
jgi:hypothetical protein